MKGWSTKLRGRMTLGLLVTGVSAALIGLPVLVSAQQQEEESASNEGGDVGTDTSLMPRPAASALRASASLLLSLAKAGNNWVAVGQRGDILLSSDGMTWKQVPVPVDVTLIRVRFIDDQHGWATGYDGTVIATTNGGMTWTLAQFDAAWGKPWYDVLFADAENGLLVGANGSLKRTTDGGKTLTAIESDVLADSPNLYNLIKLGNGNLLIAGERGFVALSVDNGDTWKQMKSPYSGSYFGAIPLGQTGAVIFGLRGNAFYAADIGKSALLDAKDLEALRAAALDAESSGRSDSPVTAVAGWTRLASDDTESLFGGSVSEDGRALLFGANGRVMQVDAEGSKLKPLPLGIGININMGLIAGNDLITVGTSGVKRLPLPQAQ